MATATAKIVWLNTREAAEMLGLKPQTLESWRIKGRGGLPFYRSGRLVRYMLSDVQRHIERNRHNG